MKGRVKSEGRWQKGLAEVDSISGGIEEAEVIAPTTTHEVVLVVFSSSLTRQDKKTNVMVGALFLGRMFRRGLFSKQPRYGALFRSSTGPA